MNGGSAITTFTYDNANRVSIIVKSPDNYEIRIEYDALDRPTTITYNPGTPNVTTEEFEYTDPVRGMTLDLTQSTDRLGHVTKRHYNSDRNMDSITEGFGTPDERTTVFGWCDCGSLLSITDPNSHTTTFERDLQNRVYRKKFHGNTTTIDYLYEGQSAPQSPGATSRLASSTDALGRWTRYSYYPDDNVSDVRYTDAGENQLVPATPTVQYSYDPNYNRIEGIVNGVASIDYEYYEINAASGVNAGRLHTVHESIANETISYTYDELGRVHSRAINGVTETITHDAMDRVTATENVLTFFQQQPFVREYEGPTSRLAHLTYPNGQQKTNYLYWGNAKDRRLNTIQNVYGAASSNISQFDYDYDSDGRITSWTKLLGTTESGLWFDYDNVEQLRGARNASDINNATSKLQYDYDPAGNRNYDRNYNPNPPPSFEVNNTYEINELNQVESLTEGGMVIGEPRLFGYDSVGNMIDDGGGKTFEWDAANRLVAINYVANGNRTEFAYDGLGRRVKIIEYGPGVTAEIEPTSTSYTNYTTGKLMLPAGLYTITIQGLNPSGAESVLVQRECPNWV